MDDHTFKLDNENSSFLQRCNAVRLTKKEQMICDFIKNNSREIIHMSIAEVAEQCKTSEASFVRFSKKLGLKGFQALKICVAQDVVSPSLQFHEELDPNDTVTTIAHKVFHSYELALNETLSILDMTKLESAARQIANAKRVFFFAVGASGNVAEDILNKFIRIGILAYYHADTNMQRMAASMVQPGDVVVAISHSGATLATIEPLMMSRQNGAKTIVITNFSRSPILQHGDICLFTSARETQYKGEPTASRIAQLTILDSIIAVISNSNSKYYFQNLQKTRQALDATKI